MIDGILANVFSISFFSTAFTGFIGSWSFVNRPLEGFVTPSKLMHSCAISPNSGWEVNFSVSFVKSFSEI